MLLNLEEFSKIYEINQSIKNNLMEYQSEFTISYEIELCIKHPTDDLLELISFFEIVFKPLVNKYDLNIDYDNSLMNTVKNKTLYYGIEVKPELYFKGINKAFEFLDMFYEIYNKQKHFYFSDKTGLHINIGYTSGDSKNIFKGYLLLNDDYAYKSMDGRENSGFSDSFKKDFKRKSIEYMHKYAEYSNKQFMDNIDKISVELSTVIKYLVKLTGDKNVGFNTEKLISGNYIEFRYPGGDISKDLVKEKTFYFANIVLAIFKKEYRKKEFIKKYINFINSLFIK